MNPVLVAGTGSEWRGDRDWYYPGHPFGQMLSEQGCAPRFDESAFPRLEPFVWSTDIAGIPLLTSHRVWQTGAAALAYFIRSEQRLRSWDTALIVHSHGLQVAAYAALDRGLKVQTLVSVGSPLRADMSEGYDALRRNTKYWLHLHSDKSDRWQWYGALFDGHFGIVRQTPLADRNDGVPGVGHSNLLRDPATYHHWVERGWLDRLRG